jgi:acyl-CoA reductase-like NAD-dependent aldehyde dehydrogenase
MTDADRTTLSDAVLERHSIWGAFINGAWVVPAQARTYDVHEASNGTVLARVAEADRELVNEAVRNARHAYETTWRDLSPRERAGYLRQVAAVIRSHAEELAELCAREVGKPKRDALLVDVVSSHTNFDYYAGIADTVHGQLLHQGPVEAHVTFEPYGVVAAILPFNWPVQHVAKKCAPALAAGNTVVVKPGEQAPLAILRLIELANEVLPPGVLNAVNGVDAGPALLAHRRIERVTFTGSTQTGRKVMQAAAEHLTYVTLELGGKNALIVLDDADVDAAVRVAIEGMFYNNGMACTSTSRLVVHESLYDEFATKFVAAARQLVIGEPLDPATDIGPMVDRRQQERVMSYVSTTLTEGATLLFEGALPEHLSPNGFWVAPRIFGDVTSAMTIAHEEVFGPVAALMRFSTEEEAVTIANDTEYGLTAAICTSDERRAARLAPRLEVGMVFVNQYTRRTFIGSPFGGVKGSGYGREYSAETLLEFVRAKNVRFPSGHGVMPTWPPRA